MKDEQTTLHAAVITEEVIDHMYSTIGNYMEDVLHYDPYMSDFAEKHDELMFEVIKMISNTKFSIK